MKIETKLNLNDAAYFLHENKITNGSVVEIEVKVWHQHLNIVYTIFVDGYGCRGKEKINVVESLTFASKDLLIKSL